MNERITELVIASQLVYKCNGELITGWMSHVDLTEYLDAFAKLLMEECITVIHESKTKDPYNGEVIGCYKNELLDEQIQYIEERFGYNDEVSNY